MHEIVQHRGRGAGRMRVMKTVTSYLTGSCRRCGGYFVMRFRQTDGNNDVTQPIYRGETKSCMHQAREWLSVPENILVVWDEHVIIR